MKSTGMNVRVVTLQICMGLIKVEPDSGSEAGVTTSDNGPEEGNINVEDYDTEDEAANIKVEELIDVKEEHPETIKFPPIKTEQEVSEWCLCVCGSNSSCSLDHILPQEGNIRK
jgi:hypothetical protein